MSRADKISSVQKTPEYFSDFTNNLDRNPVTGGIAVKTNADAVKQAIANLLLTDQNERPYQPSVGSRIKESLFGLLDDPIVLEDIKDSIKDCIKTHEPRAHVQRVEISFTDNNELRADIYFNLINIQEVFTATVLFNRVR